MADLNQIVRAHVANQGGALPPALETLRLRARRRRQRHVGGVVVIVAGAVFALGPVVAGAGMPWNEQRDTARIAAPVAVGGVLDEGVDDAGPWKVVAESDPDEGWCVRHITTTGQGGACELATPGRLDEATSFATSDGPEPLTVVAGAVPDNTSTVQVELSDGTTRQAVVRTVSGRPFFSIRIAAAVTVDTLTALDADGLVLEQVGPLPPPPPPVMPSIEPPLTPPLTPQERELGPSETPESVCTQAYEQQVGREYLDTSEAGRDAFINGCVQSFGSN